jgi:DNA-binding transcriptional MerR regulator
MQIGDLARQSGIPAKTIRFYESIGVLVPPPRAANNYRRYDAHDVERLRFIAGARALGIGLESIAALVAAFAQDGAPCVAMQATLDQQLALVDQRITELMNLRAQLATLRQEGAARPIDRTGQHCICALVAAQADGRGGTYD